jgi:hypothetical protein
MPIFIHAYSIFLKMSQQTRYFMSEDYTNTCCYCQCPYFKTCWPLLIYTKHLTSYENTILTIKFGKYIFEGKRTSNFFQNFFRCSYCSLQCRQYLLGNGALKIVISRKLLSAVRKICVTTVFPVGHHRSTQNAKNVPHVLNYIQDNLKLG